MRYPVMIAALAALSAPLSGQDWERYYSLVSPDSGVQVLVMDPSVPEDSAGRYERVGVATRLVWFPDVTVAGAGLTLSPRPPRGALTLLVVPDNPSGGTPSGPLSVVEGDDRIPLMRGDRRVTWRTLGYRGINLIVRLEDRWEMLGL